jgi:uncharacterized protein (TIGR02599 family)
MLHRNHAAQLQPRLPCGPRQAGIGGSPTPTAIGRRFFPKAFTLVELLVATALLVMVIAIVVQITNQVSRIWRSSASMIQSFQEARAGFEAMSRNVSQATLNTYFDYYNDQNQPRTLMNTAAELAAFTPKIYDRNSDLHFISGQARTILNTAKDGDGNTIATQTHAAFFQAPLGYAVGEDYRKLNNALNACGYFLQFDDAASTIPDHVKNAPGYKPRYRNRLMEMLQPTENLAIYDPAAVPDSDWFVKNACANSRIIAENVIALALLPKLASREDDPNKAGKGVSLAPNFNYNSRIPLNAPSDPAWSGATPPFPSDVFTAHPVAGSPYIASRHAQLPPIMRVVMIVIDEPSAALLQGSAHTLPYAIDLSATGLFTDAGKLDDDVQAVEDICNAKPGNLTGNTLRLTYRVFNSDIIIRGAKWSNK